MANRFRAWSRATRLGASATELPEVAEELVEDLRQGRLTLEIRQSMLLQAQERLGRRVFTGILLGGTIVGASILLATDHALLGGAMLAGAVGWGFLHSIALALSRGRPQR